MDYKNILKFIFIVFLILVIIFTVIYYAAVTRAENSYLQKEDIGLESASLNKVFNFIEDLFKKEEYKNTATITNFLNNNSVNRVLLNECLMKVENEWEELLIHYDKVLGKCISLDLSLNGDKLFEVGECENQISPHKLKDKNRIQNDKEECFTNYSERW